MGKFKDQGNPDVTLIEEMAEATQIICKKIRFNGDWDEVPDGKSKSRWQELSEEMEDVLYQWNRLVIEYHQSTTDNAPLSEINWGLLAQMNKNMDK
jgi:hypothetical protein